jgi:hypothetical protein
VFGGVVVFGLGILFTRGSFGRTLFRETLGHAIPFNHSQ